MSSEQGAFSQNLCLKYLEKKWTKQKSRLKYEFFIIDGEDKGKTFSLEKGPVAIGRKLPRDTRGSDILITDLEATISTEQARITWDENKKLHIIHYVAGTKNPTIVEGTIIIGPTYLNDGFKIVMGRNALIYRKQQEIAEEESREEKRERLEKAIPIEGELDRQETISEEDLLINTGYTFKVLSGAQVGEKFELNRDLISVGKFTGREKRGWILLDSSFISIDQAILRWMRREKKFGILHTKGAANPTFVNGREISDKDFTMLERGDILQIGSIKMILGKQEETECESSIKTIEQKDVDPYKRNVPYSETLSQLETFVMDENEIEEILQKKRQNGHIKKC